MGQTPVFKHRVCRNGIVFLLLVMLGSGFLFCRRIPRTGIGFKGGAFGIPNQLLDLLIYEHPEIKGNFYSFEIWSHGSRGPRSLFSGLYSLEYSKMSGQGAWRDEQGHRRLDGAGELSQVSFTATIIMKLIPGSHVTPYFGGGLGVSKVSLWYEGTYTDELGTQIKDSYRDDRILPVGHLPVGILISLKDHVVIRAEGGFKNGFYLGAGMQINF